MSNMKTLMAVFLAALSVALLSPVDLCAQAGATGAITGTVLDQKGGAIAGAVVVVTNLATGQKEREVLRACRGCAPAQIAGRIVEEVFAFAKGCSQGDDMTLVVVSVKDESGS